MFHFGHPTFAPPSQNHTQKPVVPGALGTAPRRRAAEGGVGAAAEGRAAAQGRAARGGAEGAMSRKAYFIIGVFNHRILRWRSLVGVVMMLLAFVWWHWQ